MKLQIFRAWAAMQQRFLRQVLKTKAASTLRRHVPGWRLCMEFGLGQTWRPLEPDLASVVSFLRTNAEAGHSCAAPVASMKFVASLLGWKQLITILDNTVVAAWCAPLPSRQVRKEALPLPLFVVAAFEKQDIFPRRGSIFI